MHDVAHKIIGLAREQGWRICAAESVTGGRIAAALTAVSGASEVFFAGGVFYDVRAKMRFLGLTDEFFNELGVYSIECAVEMASRWRERCDADVCIATTGEAEPADTPHGRVFFSVATAEATEHTDIGFSGNREQIQQAATEHALQYLLKVMQEKLR